MTAPIKSCSGFQQSFHLLADNFGAIFLGSAAGGGVGYLIGGTPMAWLAAKITGLMLGIYYTIRHPACAIQPNVDSEQNRRARETILGCLSIPPLLIHGIHFGVRVLFS